MRRIGQSLQRYRSRFSGLTLRESSIFGQCQRHLKLKILWYFLPSRSSDLAKSEPAKRFQIIEKRSEYRRFFPDVAWSGPRRTPDGGRWLGLGLIAKL